MCAGFSLKKPTTVSVSIDVRITMIRCVVHLLRIFEMFHGIMNNPVYAGKTRTILHPYIYQISYRGRVAIKLLIVAKLFKKLPYCK